MKKIELEIIAISHSITQTQSYAVVLGEVNGSRRLPIVIGGFEAQAIAVALEKMNPSRPLTHDLMKNFLVAFGIDLHEVIINDLQEGVFYSKLVCSNEQDTIEIDSRTSDAIAMAVRFGCPIYTFEHILQNAGILLEETEDSKRKKNRNRKPGGRNKNHWTRRFKKDDAGRIKSSFNRSTGKRRLYPSHRHSRRD